MSSPYKPGDGAPQQGREDAPASIPNRPAKPIGEIRPKQSPRIAQKLGNPYYLRRPDLKSHHGVEMTLISFDEWAPASDERSK